MDRIDDHPENILPSRSREGPGEGLARQPRPATLRARDLRNHPTEAERHLWRAISARKLAGFRFNRQVRIGVYFCDFVCRGERLIIELDGGQHNSQGGKAYDERRTAFLRAQGYQVIRFWNHDVLGNLPGVLFRIEQALAGRPSPSPSQMGGEAMEPRDFDAG